MPSARDVRCTGSGRGSKFRATRAMVRGHQPNGSRQVQLAQGVVGADGSDRAPARNSGVTVSAAGIDDYPYRGTANQLDRWGFYTGYCTSFAAFRLSQEGVRLHGASLQGPNGKTAFFGNGGTWDAAAASIGYVVDTHPTVGSVAVWHGGEDGAWWGG